VRAVLGEGGGSGSPEFNIIPLGQSRARQILQKFNIMAIMRLSCSA